MIIIEMKSNNLINKKNEAKRLESNPVLYAKKDVVNFLGVSKDKLQYWIRSGVVIPTVCRSGRGKRHQFDEKTLFYIELVHQFDSLGFDLNSIKKMLGQNEVEIKKMVRGIGETSGRWDKKPSVEKKKTTSYLSIKRVDGEAVLSCYSTFKEATDNFKPSKVPGKRPFTAPTITIIALNNVLVQLKLKILKHRMEGILKTASKKKKFTGELGREIMFLNQVVKLMFSGEASQTLKNWSLNEQERETLFSLLS